jgi:hypothetical protein
LEAKRAWRHHARPKSTTTAHGAFLPYRIERGTRVEVGTGSSWCALPSQIWQFRVNSRRLRPPQPPFMNASAHGHVLRSRWLDGPRFEAGRGRLAHLVNAYLDEMSKAVIGLVGHVLTRLEDGLTALFRYDAAHENDAERTARHFDERGDKIERKGIRGEAFGLGNKCSRGRLLSRRRRRRSGARPASPGHGGRGQLALNRSTPRCPPWPSMPQAQRRSPW